MPPDRRVHAGAGLSCNGCLDFEAVERVLTLRVLQADGYHAVIERIGTRDEVRDAGAAMSQIGGRMKART